MNNSGGAIHYASSYKVTKINETLQVYWKEEAGFMKYEGNEKRSCSYSYACINYTAMWLHLIIPERECTFCYILTRSLSCISCTLQKNNLHGLDYLILLVIPKCMNLAIQATIGF